MWDCFPWQHTAIPRTWLFRLVRHISATTKVHSRQHIFRYAPHLYFGIYMWCSSENPSCLISYFLSFLVSTSCLASYMIARILPNSFICGSEISHEIFSKSFIALYSGFLFSNGLTWAFLAGFNFEHLSRKCTSSSTCSQKHTLQNRSSFFTFANLPVSTCSGRMPQRKRATRLLWFVAG